MQEKPVHQGDFSGTGVTYSLSETSPKRILLYTTFIMAAI